MSQPPPEHDALAVGPYRARFAFHRARREWDAAWCAAAVLVLLGEPTDEEREHYDLFSPREANVVKSPLDDVRRNALIHGTAKDASPADYPMRFPDEYEWARRVLGLGDERFNPEPPTLDLDKIYDATKAVGVEHYRNEKSADRAALLLSGSFAAFAKMNRGDEQRKRAALAALCPFAVSSVHVDLRHHLGRNIDARRARTIEEMQFYASLHPCKACAGRLRELVVEPRPDFYVLRGRCPFCRAPAAFGFFVEGDPTRVRPRPFELGPDARPTEIVPRALLVEEQSRSMKEARWSNPLELGPAEWHARVQANHRVIITSGEMAKIVTDTDLHAYTRDLSKLSARRYMTAYPRIAELEGKRLSLRDEIAGLLAQIMHDRLPTAEDLRAYFAARYVRSITRRDHEIVVVLAVSDVTAVRLWDDVSGTHALLAVAKGTSEDVGERERVVEGHRVHFGAVTLDTGALTRVTVDFLLKEVTTIPIAFVLAKVLDPSGPPKTVGVLADVLGITLDASLFPACSMGCISVARIGVGATVSNVSGKYRYDPFHEPPIRSVDALRARTLFEWSAELGDADAAAAEAALRERFGAARECEKALVFGAFAVARRAPLTLSWYSVLPDWALVQPDPERRREVLLAIARMFEATPELSATTKVAAMVPADSGIVHEAASSSGVRLKLAPAVPALELVRVLGWHEPVAETFTMHQDRWELRVVAGKNEYALKTALPRLGAWTLKATLDGRPTGGKCGSDAEAPPGGRYFITPEDVVRTIEIESSPIPGTGRKTNPGIGG